MNTTGINKVNTMNETLQLIVLYQLYTQDLPCVKGKKKDREVMVNFEPGEYMRHTIFQSVTVKKPTYSQ